MVPGVAKSSAWFLPVFYLPGRSKFTSSLQLKIPELSLKIVLSWGEGGRRVGRSR